MNSSSPIVNPSSPAFFEAKYQQSPDPWDFAHNAGELSRYDATLAALGSNRYRRAFEPGCSVGVLTERLAAICDHVEASDFSATAVAEARRRCAHLPQVHLSCAALSDVDSLADFDLVVLSEIGYYFTLDDWRRLSTRLIDSIPSRATLLAVHWLGHSPDHQISGDQVHAVLLESLSLHLEDTQRHAAFRLDRWVRL